MKGYKRVVQRNVEQKGYLNFRRQKIKNRSFHKMIGFIKMRVCVFGMMYGKNNYFSFDDLNETLDLRDNLTEKVTDEER